jgi:kinesin family protein 1
MDGNTTRLLNPNAMRDTAKQFTFDHSYWSHDGYKEEQSMSVPDLKHERGHAYADQARVYEETGRTILNNAWLGYNAALFAYGQTGSGKSYSVVGFSKNKGNPPDQIEK